jgi:hypothetical protein
LKGEAHWAAEPGKRFALLYARAASAQRNRCMIRAMMKTHAMKSIVPTLGLRASLRAVAALGFAAALSGCVVAPRHGYYARGDTVQSAPQTLPPMYFYPERQQSDTQQDRDRFECYRWASHEAGVDPGMTALRSNSPVIVADRGEVRDGAPVVAGAATGAMLGAIASPRHPGENAIIGAIFGAALGAIAQESRAQAVERSQARHQEAAQASQVPLDNFRRAMSACMSGRGYRVG